MLAHDAPCCLAASIQNGDFVVIVDVQGPNALIWCGRVGFMLQLCIFGAKTVHVTKMLHDVRRVFYD